MDLEHLKILTWIKYMASGAVGYS